MADGGRRLSACASAPYEVNNHGQNEEQSKDAANRDTGNGTLG